MLCCCERDEQTASRIVSDYNIDLGEWGVSSVPALMAKIVETNCTLFKYATIAILGKKVLLWKITTSMTGFIEPLPSPKQPVEEGERHCFWLATYF